MSLREQYHQAVRLERQHVRVCPAAVSCVKCTQLREDVLVLRKQVWAARIAWLCGLVGLTLTLCLLSSPIVAQGPSLVVIRATEAAALKGHMAGFGFTTQAAFAVATGIPATRISVVSRGLDTLTNIELDSLTRRLFALYRSGAYDTLRMRTRLRASYLRVFPIVLPQPVTVYPLMTIVNQGMTTGIVGGDTYQVNVPAHGLIMGTKVIIRDHHAVPSFDGVVLYVAILNSNVMRLYRDSALSQVLVVTTKGVGGTLQRQP